MAAVRRERNPLLWSTVAERALAKGVSLAWGIQSVCVSADQQSCLEGMFTMRRSEG